VRGEQSLLEFKEFLTAKKESIGEAWYQRIAGTYPADTASFLVRKKDRFDNPVGHAIAQTTGGSLDCLIDGAESAELRSCLQPLVRIRAVQNFSPSEAVSFVFLLEDAVAEVLGGVAEEAGGAVLSALRAAVREMALLCFDIYAECREDISQVKQDELKRNLYMLVRKAKDFGVAEVVEEGRAQWRERNA
jgi:hypothetical protein